MGRMPIFNAVTCHRQCPFLMGIGLKNLISEYMTIFDSIKKVAMGANELLKKTKIVSTLAPIVGTAFGKPGLGSAIGAGAGALGYQKGGRVLKAHGMAMGGKVKPKQKKPKAPAKHKPHKAKKSHM